jgi:nucleotide-binding universal stress UspA family protein
MYERIVVAVDHSESSPRVLAAAKEMALLSRDSEVWVVHLREREVIARLDEVPSETDTEANSAVSQAVDELTRSGIHAHGEIRETIFGHAAKEIVESANDKNASIIVMGTRGRSDIAGLVLGSVAHKVLHLTERPVLVVR